MKNWPWHSIRLIALIFTLVFLYSFAAKKNNTRNLSEITIELTDESKNTFITPQIVNNLLKQKFGSILTIEKEKVDLNRIEKVIDLHPNVDKSEVYETIDGALKIAISQKQPIARVLSAAHSYYIDSLGVSLPLSEVTSARVLVVKGTSELFKDKNVLALINYINADDFLKQNIIGLDIVSQNKVELFVRDHEYKLSFGKPILIEEKFKKYKAFYQFVSNDTIVKSYELVDLTFANQIVCK